MSTNAGAAALIAVAIAAAVVAAPRRCGAADLTHAQVEQIVAGIQERRGLNFRTRVPLSYMTPEQVARRLRIGVEKENKEEAVKLSTQVGQMLGLYPAGLDVTDSAIGMLKSEIAGFYDFHKKDMVIVEMPAAARRTESAATQRLESLEVIAHELTHALQDQNFDLSAVLDRVVDDDDRTISVRSVTEGDATLAGFGYVAGRIDDQVLDLFVKQIPEMEKRFAEKTAAVPLGVREPFIFQYMYGARFVAEAYHRNGWAGVNQLYEYPPQSSQQILNPWMYFDKPTPPPHVHLTGYEQVLKDWKEADQTSFGELLLRVILQSTTGEHSAFVALSNAWAGDRAVILKKRNSVTVLWMIAFTNEESAATFAAAYHDVLDKIHGGHTAHRVERHARTVLAMVGDGAIRFHEYLANVWSNSTVGGKLVAAAADDSPPPFTLEPGLGL